MKNNDGAKTSDKTGIMKRRAGHIKKNPQITTQKEIPNIHHFPGNYWEGGNKRRWELITPELKYIRSNWELAKLAESTPPTKYWIASEYANLEVQQISKYIKYRANLKTRRTD